MKLHKLALNLLALVGVGCAVSSNDVNATYADTLSKEARKLGGQAYANLAVAAVNLNGSRLTDSDLVKLSQISAFGDLEVLLIQRTLISDSGLAALSKCYQLKTLDLGETALSDAGVNSLLSLKNLSQLNLTGTLIGDAGLEVLQKCTNLTSLTLYDTNVSANGVLALHRRLPRCRIYWGTASGSYQVRDGVVSHMVIAPLSPTGGFTTSPAATPSQRE